MSEQLATDDGRSIREVELWAFPYNGVLSLGRFSDMDEVRQAAARNGCAVVHIPYHTETAVFSFDVWLLHLPADLPAIFEMKALSAMVGQMYRDFVEKGK